MVKDSAVSGAAHPPALEQEEGLVEEDGQVGRLAVGAAEYQVDQLLHHLHTHIAL